MWVTTIVVNHIAHMTTTAIHNPVVAVKWELITEWDGKAQVVARSQLLPTFVAYFTGSQLFAVYNMRQLGRSLEMRLLKLCVLGSIQSVV